MAGGVGQTTLDFGSFPGLNQVSSVVTGISAIEAGAKVEAFLMKDTTIDHTGNDHVWVSMFLQLACGDVVPGVGFTVYGQSLEKLSGSFTINYVWVNV